MKWNLVSTLIIPYSPDSESKNDNTIITNIGRLYSIDLVKAHT